LIDERRGRRIAARLNLRYTGILGILFEAKNRGLISVGETLARRLDRSSRILGCCTLYTAVFYRLLMKKKIIPFKVVNEGEFVIF
jgi:hypothetical protein